MWHCRIRQLLGLSRTNSVDSNISRKWGGTDIGFLAPWLAHTPSTDSNIVLRTEACLIGGSFDCDFQRVPYACLEEWKLIPIDAGIPYSCTFRDCQEALFQTNEIFNKMSLLSYVLSSRTLRREASVMLFKLCYRAPLTSLAEY